MMKKFFPIGLFILLVILITGVNLVTHIGKGSGFGVSAQPMADEGQEIEYLEQLLASGKLDPAGKKAIEEKLSMLKFSIESRANSTQMGVMGDVPTPISVQDPAFPEGVFEGDEGLFKPNLYKMNNRWQGMLDGNYIQVFAGYSVGEKRGVVIVVKTSIDRMTTTSEKYYPVNATPGLWIIEKLEGKLSINDGDENDLLFDIHDKRFE